MVPAAVLLVFAVARRYLPATARPPRTIEADEELTARFQTTRWVFQFSMVLIGVMFAWLMHAVLVGLNHYLSVAQSPEGFRLWPQTAIWWFFPGFGALALPWEIALLLWSALGDPEEAALYSFWNNQRAGFDSRKVLRWIAALFLVPIAILTALALPMHATLRQNDIIDCGYAFAGCRTYGDAEARRMTQIDGHRNRDGKLVAEAGIVIDFQDGRRWSSAEWRNFEPSVDPALAGLLKAKTGLPIGHAVTEGDIDIGTTVARPPR